MKPLKKAPADTAAGVSGALLVILSAFDVPSKLGISVDEMGAVLGAIAMIAATIRGWIVSQRKADTGEK